MASVLSLTVYRLYTLDGAKRGVRCKKVVRCTLSIKSIILLYSRVLQLTDEQDCPLYCVLVFFRRLNCILGSLRGTLPLGCPRNQKKKFRFKPKKPRQDLFRLCFGLFLETKKQNLGLFPCFELLSKQPKQTERFSKQTETDQNFLKMPKYAL